ncbi:MAG: hypothetical protein ACJ746_18190 [Bryobacteraceae bacterium]
MPDNVGIVELQSLDLSMSFEQTYLAERKLWESETDKIVGALKPLALRRSGAETSYELMDATIFHVLHPETPELRANMSRCALQALLVNRNIDHVPGYAGKLCDYLDVEDEAGVLAQAAHGRSFLFAGFHTGPYWSIIQGAYTEWAARNDIVS